MNRRSVLAHAILAIGGLTLAYLVWTEERPSTGVDEVQLVDCDPEDVTQVQLRSEAKDVTLEITRDDDSLSGRATVTRHAEGADDETQRFVVSTEALSEWLEQVAPLRARRTLGELSEAQLEEIELAEATGGFVITCGGTEHRFEVGGRAYGSGDRYVRPESGGPVSLLGSDRLLPLETAEFRLMERRLHTFLWTAATQLTVQGWGAQKTLLQRNRLDAQHAEWVDEASPDRRNEVFGNWLAAYEQLRAQRYLDRGGGWGGALDVGDAPPTSTAAQAAFEITIRGEDGPLGHMEMWRADVAPPVYYIRTETTLDWVRVPASVARSIEDDARSVLGLDPLERAAPSPAGVDPQTAGAEDSGGDAAAPPSAAADAGVQVPDAG